MKKIVVGILAILLCSALTCSKKSETFVELARFPLDDLEGLISQTGIEIDTIVSSDGNGALRIDAAEPTVVRLFELGDLDVEYAQIVYRAKLKCENLEGIAYLEMWCGFPEGGEFFSRGLETPISETTDWTTEEIPFLLKKGENPYNIKLNLGVNGTGTVWIDDVQVLKGPLE